MALGEQPPRVDTSGELDRAFSEGSFEAVRSKNRKCSTREERRESLESAYQACLISPPVTVGAMAEYLNITDRAVRDRIKESQDLVWVKGGNVGRYENK